MPSRVEELQEEAFGKHAAVASAELARYVVPVPVEGVPSFGIAEHRCCKYEDGDERAKCHAYGYVVSGFHTAKLQKVIGITKGKQVKVLKMVLIFWLAVCDSMLNARRLNAKRAVNQCKTGGD